jgi:hypothetical protein
MGAVIDELALPPFYYFGFLRKTDTTQYLSKIWSLESGYQQRGLIA